ncbi:hypothetical protein NAA74_12905 [Listeria monocytogenes]|nr:hypothetical protein [Listeria monocytogenes]
MIIIEFLHKYFLEYILKNSIAIFALVFSIYQFIKGYNINSGAYLLELRNVFLEEKKNTLHLELRNKSNYAPEDWAVVDDYLGTFEVVYIMIKRGALNKSNIKELYSYRVSNIVRNQEIFEKKLVLEYKSWGNFYQLISKFDGKRWNKFYEFLHKIETTQEINFSNYCSVSDLLKNLDADIRNEFEIELRKLERHEIGQRLTNNLSV